MAVIDWTEAQEAASLVAHNDGRNEWQCPYNLTVDSATDDGKTIVEHFASIGRGLNTNMVYGNRADGSVICKTISPQRVPLSRFHWTAVLSYSPLDQEDQQDQTDEDGNPTEDPLEYRYDISSGVQYFQVPCFKAWLMDVMPLGGAGAGYARPVETLGPIHNSAGVVYDPPLTREIPETVLRVTGNVPQYDDQLFALGGCINRYKIRYHESMAKYGFLNTEHQPYCVKCNGVTAEFQKANGVQYWRYTFEWIIRKRSDTSAGEIMINPQDGFLENVLDRGITRLAGPGDDDGAGDTITGTDIKAGMAEAAPVKSWEGDRIPELVLFDGHGQPLRGSSTLAAPPVFFRWRLHPYADFYYPFVPLKIFQPFV